MRAKALASDSDMIFVVFVDFMDPLLDLNLFLFPCAISTISIYSRITAAGSEGGERASTAMHGLACHAMSSCAVAFARSSGFARTHLH